MLLILYMVTSLVHEARDLGILIDTQLSYKQHISNVVAEAYMRAGQILRCFLSRDTETLVRAFVTYVRLNWNIVPRFGLPLQWV